MAIIGVSEALEELNVRGYNILMDLPRSCSGIYALFCSTIYILGAIKSEINNSSLCNMVAIQLVLIRRHIVT